MSALNSLGLDGQDGRANDIAEEPVVVEQMIAHVLGRAHRTAEAQHAPDEARAILRVAHTFADELEAAHPRFDRLRFIKAATEDYS